MQIEIEGFFMEREEDPFQIVHNARSSKASRSRKSSIHTVDKEKTRQRIKKLRKMTLNPETFHFREELASINEQTEHKAAQSEKNEIDNDEDFSMSDFLDLGGPIKTASKHEQELESGIFVGIGTERELNSDFNLGVWQDNQIMELEIQD